MPGSTLTSSVIARTQWSHETPGTRNWSVVISSSSIASLAHSSLPPGEGIPQVYRVVNGVSNVCVNIRYNSRRLQQRAILPPRHQERQVSAYFALLASWRFVTV